MCMPDTSVRSIERFRWQGDEIVHDCAIPASRIIPGTRKSGYPIDIREYVTGAGNAVVRKHLQKLVDGLSPEDRARFAGHARGSFDLRRDAVAEYVARNVRYERGDKRLEPWLFPGETLAIGRGDCEDIAFLTAALLEESGISGYCIRVAFGRVEIVLSLPDGTKRRESSDHAWVMYLDEGGVWEIVEPLHLAAQRVEPEPDVHVGASSIGVEYVPQFVFNRAHLFRVRGPGSTLAPLAEYLAERRFWDGFDPSFGLRVHESIFDRALVGMPAADRQRVRRASRRVDVNVLAYDPRDHFDFAYIDEGWERVHARLASRSLDDFGRAVHAIGDFYAHSLYGELGPKENGRLVPYSKDLFSPRDVRYDFSPYPLPGSSVTHEEAAAIWSGKLVSGQWWRFFTTFPDDLQNATDFGRRRALPDHDAIAVDSPTRESHHLRYDDAEYARQFALRRDAAVEHIRNAYEAWRV